MTTTQLSFRNYLEDVRHNQAQEDLKARELDLKERGVVIDEAKESRASLTFPYQLESTRLGVIDQQEDLGFSYGFNDYVTEQNASRDPYDADALFSSVMSVIQYLIDPALDLLKAADKLPIA